MYSATDIIISFPPIDFVFPCDCSGVGALAQVANWQADVVEVQREHKTEFRIQSLAS